MKKIIIALILINTLLFAATSKTFSYLNEYGGKTVIQTFAAGDQYFDKQNIVKLVAYSDKSGKVVKTESYSKNNSVSIQFFNSRKKLTKRSQINPDSTKVFDTYDGAEKILTRSFVNKLGKKTAFEEFAKGEIIKRTWFDDDEKPTSSEEFKNNKIHKKNWYNSKAEVKQTDVYNDFSVKVQSISYFKNSKKISFFEDKKLVRIEFYKNKQKMYVEDFINEKLVTKTNFENGNKVSLLYFNENSKKSKMQLFKSDSLNYYTEFYSTNGKVTHYTESLPNNYLKTVKLDFFGRKEIEEVSDSTGFKTEKTKYQNGKRILKTTINPDSSYTITKYKKQNIDYEQSFDKNNELISRTIFSKNIPKQTDYYEKKAIARVQFYDANGKPTHSIYAKDGDLKGSKDELQANGELKRTWYDFYNIPRKIDFLKNNKIVRQQIFNSYGVIELDTYYKGKEKVKVKELSFNNDGIKLLERYFKNGVIEKEKWFTYEGKLKAKSEFTNGIKIKCIEFYENYTLNHIYVNGIYKFTQKFNLLGRKIGKYSEPNFEIIEDKAGKIIYFGDYVLKFKNESGKKTIEYYKNGSLVKTEVQNRQNEKSS